MARLAGVSKATVSSVINNKPHIAPETRDRVLEVIRKLQYRPNRIARSLSAQRTHSIGLVVKQIDNPYFAQIMRGVYDEANLHGYIVLLGSSELSPERERHSVDALLQQWVDGLVISPLQGEGADLSYLGLILQNGPPLVFLERVPNFKANSVDIQNAKAAEEAVSYLIALGHRHIAYFSGPSYSIHNRERLEGFRKAMEAHGLSVPPHAVHYAGVYIEDGYRAGKEVFSRSEYSFTAVFCFNDLVAIGAMNAICELGLSVPDDVSIIGFDNIAFCNFARVPLTSVRVPTYEMGRESAKLLFRQIQEGKAENPEVVILNAELVYRKSCAPPKITSK